MGSGQTGCQLSEELHEAGREVFLACGRAPWLPRRPDGRDIVSWLKETTFFDTPLSALPSPAARLGANLLVTGQRGGHDLHYRTLQAMGVQLLGHLAGVEGHRALFAGDLADSVAFGDARYADIRELLAEQLASRGIAAPELPDPPPFHADPPLELDLNGFGVVIVTSGFRPDYTHWMRFPAFDAMGFPLTDNGASTVVLGLFFCGVHFLRKRKSSVLFGVGEDAAIVAQSIARTDHSRWNDRLGGGRQNSQSCRSRGTCAGPATAVASPHESDRLTPSPVAALQTATACHKPPPTSDPVTEQQPQTVDDATKE